MTGTRTTRTPTPADPEQFGHDVVGPIVAEFCLRLWSLTSQLDDPDDVALMFCARGGLRMQLAHERFLAASGLGSSVRVAPLMVSRLVAMRPTLARTVEEDLPHLLPAASRTLRHEFGSASLAEVAVAMTGVAPSDAVASWSEPMTPDGLARLLHHADGRAVADELVRQSALFRRHLAEGLDGRRRAVLVDTGLHGTTGLLLGEGLPDLHVSSALIAHYYPPARQERTARTFGLQLETEGYAAWRRRSVLLRYWHYVEWLFEPALSSVREFAEVDGTVRSNLEVQGWHQRVLPGPSEAFAGVLRYLDGLGPGAATRVVPEAERAWVRFHRAVVFPVPGDADILAVSDRTHDFGRDESWGARPWRGPVSALRGATMWREGEIARSAGALRLPLLVSLQAAYTARTIKRRAARSGRRGSS